MVVDLHIPLLVMILLVCTGAWLLWRLRRAWALKESAHRQMFEANPLPMWVYDLETLRFLAVNDAAVQHYGYTRDEFLAMTIKDIRPGEDVPALLENVAKVSAGLDLAGSWRHVKRDGTLIEVEITSHTLMFAGRRAEAVLAMDVTERNRNRAELIRARDEAEQARERIAALLAAVADGLLGMDLDGRITFMNETARSLFGSEVCKAAPLSAADLSSGALAEYLAAVLTEPREERSTVVEVPAAKNAPPRIVQLRTAPVLTAAGTICGSITSLRDISHERELDRMKSEFVATAAHELFTPIATVMGYSELLLRGEEADLSSQLVRDSLGEIFAKAEVLERIVDDLLCLGRIEAGRPLLLDRRPCSLIGIVDDVVRMQQLENPRRRFVVESAETLPPFWADRQRLRQVLDNLLNNAVKFSPAEGVIRVVTRLAGDSVEIAVTDEGVGMTPEQTAAAFDKFYRGSRGNMASSGLGLGLSIARGIVEAHGGRIWINSHAGRGTTVTFSIPLLA